MDQLYLPTDQTISNFYVMATAVALIEITN